MPQAFLALFIVATLVEGITEYFFSSADKYQPWLKYAAAVIASVICVAYNLDLLAMLGMVSPIPYVGNLLTGLVVGRGSNYLNDFVTRFGDSTVIINESAGGNGGGGAAPKFVQK